MKRILLILLAFTFLFSGCLSKPQSTYCCDMESASKGICKVDATIDGKSVSETYSGTCDVAKGQCEVVKEGKELTIPICTEKVAVPCVNSSCTAMVCGPINYVPNPFKNEMSAEQLYSDAKSTVGGTPSGAFTNLESHAAKLYQGTCRFLPVDNFFKYVFENTEGSYVNTFRFGTGNTTKMYERSWPYLPVSDYYCGVNSQGFVDRYMNYLSDQSYFDSYLKTYHSTKPSIIQQFVQQDACLISTQNSQIDLHTTAYGGNYGEYLYYTEEHEGQVLTGFNKDDDPVYQKFIAPPNTEIDSDFYAKALRVTYSADISSTAGKAPFECESSLDCMSGICGTGTYSRTVCMDNDGSTAGECLCSKESFDTKLNSFVSYCKSKGPAKYSISGALSRQAIEDATALQEILYSTHKIKLGDSTVVLPQPAKIVLREFKAKELEAMKALFNYDSSKNVIGYATTDEFGKTAFAKSCNLVSGTDYVTYDYSYVPLNIPDKGSTNDYPTKYTLIFGLGTCKSGEILKSAPELKQLGWCEPCTVSTMAKATLTTVNGKPVKEDVDYFKGKTIEYLQRDVLPVVSFVTSYWDEIDGSSKSAEDLAKDKDIKIGEYLGNNGPYIVVIGNVESGPNLPSPSQTKKRAEYIRKVCNRCMTAFGVSERNFYVADESESWELYQFGKNLYTARKLFEANEWLSPNFPGCYDELGKIYKSTDKYHCDEKLLNSVDILLFDFYPNDITEGEKSLCTKDETQYSAVLDNMSAMGYRFLAEFHKPSLIYNFGIKVDSCWSNDNNANSIKGFLSYLVANQEQLTRAGLIGMFYSDYYYSGSATRLVDVEFDSNNVDYSKDMKGLKFCSVQKATNLLGMKKPIYAYYKRYEAENVKCVEKTDVQKFKDQAFGVDTPLLCDNGVSCALPIPLPIGKTSSDYSCPESTIANPCKKCSQISGTVKCTYEYEDGTKKVETHSVSSLDGDQYQEIIASLPQQYACCLEDSDGNLYSFIKMGADAPYHSPDIFSSYGNPDENCGIYSDFDESPSCSTASQMLKDYKVTCEKG